MTTVLEQVINKTISEWMNKGLGLKSTNKHDNPCDTLYRLLKANH